MKMKTIKLDPKKTRPHYKYQIDYFRAHVAKIPKGEGVAVQDFIDMMMKEHEIKVVRHYLIKHAKENNWIVYIGREAYIMNPEAK